MIRRVAVLILMISQPSEASVYLDTNVSYSQNKFYMTDYYYLGAALTGNGEDSLVRAYVYTDTGVDPSVNRVAVKKLAPQEAYVNSTMSEAKKINPIYNADIKYLSTKGMYPVVVLGTKNPNATDGPDGTNQTICLVEDADSGLIVKTNSAILKDANNADCGGIAGLEASSSSIFAAVKPNGETTFGGVNSGISVLGVSENQLSSVSVANLTSALGTLADYVTMHWDNTINRLYVGLHNSGGSPCYSLLVGYINNNTLNLSPVLPVAPDLNNYMIGTNNGMASKVYHVKTMHTSTGKSYVIVNGYVGAPDNKLKVYALPITHNQYINSDFERNTPASVGRIAKKTSTSQEEIAEAISDFLDITDPVDSVVAKVGKGDAPYQISDMFTVGDDVFICCTGNDGDKRGIFKSTALFDDTGLTASWTPWQRVMGTNDKVIGGRLDDTTGNYWYLSEDSVTTDTDLIKVTQWGKGDSNLLSTLRTNLASNFTQANAGVHQIFDFDEKTPSFLDEEFSMMISTGYQKVSFIQTGKDDSGYFEPNSGTDFNGSTYVQDRTDSALTNIGPICCAEVSRANSGNKGWIFVGGYNGVAVLMNSGSGAGWDSTTGLGSLSTISSFVFQEIGNFTNVHKLICDDNYLYVMTPQALYRVTMNAANFLNNNLTQVTIAQSGTTPFGTNDHFLDFIVSSKVGLLATTSGLFRTSDGNSVATTAVATDWSEVKTAVGSTEYSMGAVAHLNPISYSKGTFRNGGNLYALAGDMSHDLSSIFRFRVRDTSSTAIDSNTVKPITEYKIYSTYSQPAHFYNIGGFRNSFVTDGASGYHSLPKSFGVSEFVMKIKMMSRHDLIKNYESVVSLDFESDSVYCGVPVMNSASGAWVVPGDWVLRFNE